MIRKGETNSFVEICMYEPENENSIDGNIIVSREINSNGKNVLDMKYSSCQKIKGKNNTFFLLFFF